MNRRNLGCLTIALLAMFLGCGTAARAELRIIGIKITKAPESKSHDFSSGVAVSIYSEVKEENKRNISVIEASMILQKAKGWGSIVEVGIVSDSRLRDYQPVLDAIADNSWLNLVFICRSDEKLMEPEMKRYLGVGDVTK